MVIKMTKGQESRLQCICGLCTHTCLATTCLYNKICDAKDPQEEEMKQIKKLIAEVVAINVKASTNATISKKEVKCRTKKGNSSKSKK